MFGINPSDFSWWGWVLCSVAAGAVAYFVGALADTSKDDGGCSSIILAIVFYLVSFVCLCIGIVRFVKWVWQG